jgi:uncharacterized protein
MPGIANPAPARDRITVLDVLRGVAVGGILLANTFVFFGLFLIPPERAAAFSTHSLDRMVEFAEHVLVEGKFYSIFSLLFGIGFGLQLARGGDVAVSRFRRRLRVLLLIGAVHALLIWAGDILLLYALLGFIMPWFAKKDDRSLLRWTVGLLATPTILYVIACIAGMLAGVSPPPPGPARPDVPPEIFDRLAAMGSGGFADALIGNLIFFVGRWVDLFVSVRFPKVLGMFVLGLWTVRQGITANLHAHLPLLRRWRAAGWTIGFAANVIAALAFLRWPYVPPSLGGLVGVFAQAVGFPLLALGYACTIAIALPHLPRVLGVFGPVGRMALTNYLMHSVVCVTLSYGFGLGWWWQIGAATTWVVAVTIVALQIPLSRWWLASFQYGPAEWLWRRLTYGVPLPMRRR